MRTHSSNQQNPSSLPPQYQQPYSTPSPTPVSAISIDYPSSQPGRVVDITINGTKYAFCSESIAVLAHGLLNVLTLEVRKTSTDPEERAELFADVIDAVQEGNDTIPGVASVLLDMKTGSIFA